MIRKGLNAVAITANEDGVIGTGPYVCCLRHPQLVSPRGVWPDAVVPAADEDQTIQNGLNAAAFATAEEGTIGIDLNAVALAAAENGMIGIGLNAVALAAAQEEIRIAVVSEPAIPLFSPPRRTESFAFVPRLLLSPLPRKEE